MILASIQGNGFCAYGDQHLLKEHLLARMDAPELSNSRNFTFMIDPEVQDVEDGFFTLIPKIKKLIIKNPECNITLDRETVSLFRENDVLLCGVFDGIAEKLAKEHGLRFLHTELLLGSEGDAFFSGHGSETRYLRFRDSGKAYILDCYSSQTSGGEREFDLPEDFFLQEVDDFAHEWGGRFAEEIKQNKELIDLMQKAKKKGGCYLDYRK